jgi:hemoglobin-like flavoprotein
MGQALIYALSETMGSDWDCDLEEAWLEVYDQLSGEIMKAIFNESS